MSELSAVSGQRDETNEGKRNGIETKRKKKSSRIINLSVRWNDVIPFSYFHIGGKERSSLNRGQLIVSERYTVECMPAETAIC